MGGYPWPTYKATTLRFGAFKSGAYGIVDFNADLSGPVYSALTVIWDRVFKLVQWLFSSVH